MTRRKKRLPVVVDTNVLVRAFKSGSNTNWNRRIVRLWLIEGKLQLVVSPELLDEYLGIFDEVLGARKRTTHKDVATYAFSVSNTPLRWNQNRKSAF